MQAQNIDEVILILDQIILDHRERRSRLAFFAALYRAVTVRVRLGIQNGQFDDGPRMDRFDTVFANRYLAALDDWHNGIKPPRAWRAAFDAEGRSGTMILQHLLLGMNAHINFDLPLAAMSVAPGAALPTLSHDFQAINAILEALIEPMQAVVGMHSPLLSVLDRVGGRTDESLVTFSIRNARDEAWHEANRLAQEGELLRQRSILSLDRRVALLAERIIVPGGTCGLAIDLISRTENDDVRTITDALLEVN